MDYGITITYRDAQTGALHTVANQYGADTF
jgi:hypothetical protein